MSCLNWRHIFHESWENKSKFQIGGLRETGGLLLFSPVRAHLLTTAPKGQRWYLPLASRALCEANAAAAAASRQCHSTYGRCCHRLCRRQISCVERSKSWGRNSLPPLPPACANLPPAALPQRWTGVLPVHFLFAKEKQKKENEVNEQWRFIIWKRRWSAGAQVALPWPLLLI